MANITLQYDDRFWQIRKHRYTSYDKERYYPIHSLENYVNEWRYSEIYGTPESYGKQVVVTVLNKADTKWMCLSSAMYKVADLVLVEHSVGQAHYYSIMKNTYNAMMEMRSYDTEYIDNLINVYQRRPY